MPDHYTKIESLCTAIKGWGDIILTGNSAVQGVERLLGAQPDECRFALLPNGKDKFKLLYTNDRRAIRSIPIFRVNSGRPGLICKYMKEPQPTLTALLDNLMEKKYRLRPALPVFDLPIDDYRAFASTELYYSFVRTYEAPYIFNSVANQRLKFCVVPVMAAGKKVPNEFLVEYTNFVGARCTFPMHRRLPGAILRPAIDGLFSDRVPPTSTVGEFVAASLRAIGAQYTLMPAHDRMTYFVMQTDNMFKAQLSPDALKTLEPQMGANPALDRFVRVAPEIVMDMINRYSDDAAIVKLVKNAPEVAPFVPIICRVRPTCKL